MPPRTLLARVHTKIRETGASQSDVAKACGFATAHQQGIEWKSETSQEDRGWPGEKWLDQNREAPEPSPQTLETIAAKLNAGPNDGCNLCNCWLRLTSCSGARHPSKPTKFGQCLQTARQTQTVSGPPAFLEHSLCPPDWKQYQEGRRRSVSPHGV